MYCNIITFSKKKINNNKSKFYQSQWTKLELDLHAKIKVCYSQYSDIFIWDKAY